MDEDKACWSVVEALAWIKWRSLEAVELFSGAEGPNQWRASLLYPRHPTRAGGKPTADFEIHSHQPGVELSEALRRGRIVGYQVVGGDSRPFDAAFWQDGQIRPDGAFNLKSGFARAPVTFRQAEIKERWSELTEFGRYRVNTEEELRLWLTNIMSSRRRRPGDSKVALREQCELGVGPRTFSRIYHEVTRKIGNGWDKPGRAKKSS